jgi:hypothetical protein
MERAMADTRKVQEMSLAGGSLEHLRQQLQDWRAGRKLGERIPASLWAAAVDAAREQGLHRVAIELHLDYAGLKRRVERGGATPPRGEVAPRFVELSTPAASMASATERAECIVEMGNARGAKMRVELNGQGLAGLAGLCSAFWSA